KYLDFQENSCRANGAVSYSGIAVRALQDQVQGVSAQLGMISDALQTALQNLDLFLPLPVSTSAPNLKPESPGPIPLTRETPPPNPETYSEEGGDCGGFLFQCLLVFNKFPHAYQQDYSRIWFILGLLTGQALRWAEALFPNCQDFGCSFNEFLTEFKTVFFGAVDLAEQSHFAIEFRTLASGSASLPTPVFTLPSMCLRSNPSSPAPEN
uniref:DUF4939 domain-containing protein n=1 Tax=Fundulus heteroclitus TaxID=8078 RepID=A0A3Q2P791_FUNHE